MVVDLPYSVHDRYAAIAIAWTIIIVPPIFINLGLFYGLWYGRPEIDRITALTIPTAVLGVLTAVAIIERVWKLIRPSAHYRPLKSPRYGLDIFQWGYFGALILISALISSTLARGDIDNDGHDLQIRLVSLPVPVLLYYLAMLTLLSLVLNALEVKLPFRFGSCDAGITVRPAIYYIVEDVVAVDGNGGTEFRSAWMARYDGSPIFQDMIWRIAVAWTASFFVIALVFTALVLRLPVAAVYATGWAGPFPLAGLLAFCTTYYVKACLREEREAVSSDDQDTHPYEQRGQNIVSGADEISPLLTRNTENYGSGL